MDRMDASTLSRQKDVDGVSDLFNDKNGVVILDVERKELGDERLISRERKLGEGADSCSGWNTSILKKFYRSCTVNEFMRKTNNFIPEWNPYFKRASAKRGKQKSLSHIELPNADARAWNLVPFTSGMTLFTPFSKVILYLLAHNDTQQCCANSRAVSMVKNSCVAVQSSYDLIGTCNRVPTLY